MSSCKSVVPGYLAGRKVYSLFHSGADGASKAVRGTLLLLLEKSYSFEILVGPLGVLSFNHDCTRHL